MYPPKPIVFLYQMRSIWSVSPLICKLSFSSDAPLLPLTGGHLSAFWLDSGMFQRSGGLGPVPGRFWGGACGAGSPLTARFGGWSLHPSVGGVGGPLTPAPRTAWRAAFTHSWHFEFTFCAVGRSCLCRLDGFPRWLCWFRFDNFSCRHFNF